MGKADLHIHTSYSYDGSVTVPVLLEWTANFTELNVIAVTDHDGILGALEAQEMAPKYGIEVIPGSEISTQAGHLLALYIQRPIPPRLSLLETVLRVGEQGGLCIAPHPTARLAHGLSGAAIHEVLQDRDARKVLVGIETWNTGLISQRSNQKAQAIHAAEQIAATGSSDSHVFWTIGFGYTEFAGHTAQDLRHALQSYQTSAHRMIDHHPRGYWPRHIFSRMLRKMGWVTWMPEPNASFQLRRLADIQAG